MKPPAAVTVDINTNRSEKLKHFITVSILGLFPLLNALLGGPQLRRTILRSSFDNLQHYSNYSNYLTRHSNVNVVCRQPVCHNAAPLPGKIKTNAKLFPYITDLVAVTKLMNVGASEQEKLTTFRVFHWSLQLTLLLQTIQILTSHRYDEAESAVCTHRVYIYCHSASWHHSLRYWWHLITHRTIGLMDNIGLSGNRLSD